MAARLPKIITAEWALSQGACHGIVREFMEKWPDGLEVTRKNIHLVRLYFARIHKEVAVGYETIEWLQSFIPQAKKASYYKAEDDVYSKMERSKSKTAWQDYSQLVGNTLADALGLP